MIVDTTPNHAKVYRQFQLTCKPRQYSAIVVDNPVCIPVPEGGYHPIVYYTPMLILGKRLYKWWDGNIGG
jgi:hypothetical protein